MALAGRLLVLFAIALLAISIAEHKALAKGSTSEHDDNVYQVSKSNPPNAGLGQWFNKEKSKTKVSLEQIQGNMLSCGSDSWSPGYK
ncbi:hypothetical protein OsJ_29357 [Oryza sativa Japonica Group]|uniref:Uncharacterized protein n=1 Tax=Oryza sativa subsp. japonica TaxID=39947 RepID=B9G3K4_ORYSJ|nr:hypothetical protein OsJ_29357 [Oryza sativa Japonica Group]